MKCVTCHDDYKTKYITPGGVCRFCAAKARFAAFARACGLTRFPDPSGERYVYALDGHCEGKKGENLDYMDELWNALVRAAGGDEGLLINEETT